MTFRLSWTQYAMFRECPHKWYGIYPARLIPPTKNINLQVGSAMHEAIACALGDWNGIKHTPAEMVGIFSKHLKQDGVVDPDQLQYQTLVGQNMILAWYGWMTQQDFQVEEIEKKITLVDFVGVVDCIATVNGEKFIIDWKTSSSQYSQERADKDEQVTVYRWLTGLDAKVAYGVLIKGASRFQFLVSNRSQESIVNFLANLEKVRAEIRLYHSLEEAPKKPGKHCQYCDLYTALLCEGEDDFWRHV